MINIQLLHKFTFPCHPLVLFLVSESSHLRHLRTTLPYSLYFSIHASEPLSANAQHHLQTSEINWCGLVHFTYREVGLIKWWGNYMMGMFNLQRVCMVCVKCLGMLGSWSLLLFSVFCFEVFPLNFASFIGCIKRNVNELRDKKAQCTQAHN